MSSKALEAHAKHRGKWATKSKVPLATKADLASYYSPGVAVPCRAIATDPSLTNTYTNRGNTIAIVSDGSAVLGLGNIGPEAALPVMEGKAILFKTFGGVDAVPLVLNSQNPEQIITTVRSIAKSFGGINLEDIAAPNCFRIEERLKAELDIPVFHDDQHGTAIVVTAAILNAAKVTGKKLSGLKVLIIGVGAAGTAVARMVKKLGVQRIYGCNSRGLITKNEPNSLHVQKLLSEQVLDSFGGPNRTLANGFPNTDLVIGLSQANLISPAMIRLMNKNPWVFALANPVPEIMPKEAIAAGAAIVCTGRSDFDNQVNNLLAFPGLFRGILDAGITQIDARLKMVVAKAIADFVPRAKLNATFILPDIMDKQVHQHVAKRIATFWQEHKKGKGA